MGKKEMIQRNRACRERVETLIRKNKKQREEIVEAYGENLEMQEQLEALMRMIEEQRVKITAAKPKGQIRIYTRGQRGVDRGAGAGICVTGGVRCCHGCADAG